jgi:hypothetical protein
MNPLAVRSSIVIGFVQGLIGGGGSVPGMPALIYVVGVKDPHLAIGTSALAVAISAVVTLLAYVRSGHVKWRCGAAFTLAGVVGATLGSSLGKSFSLAFLQEAYSSGRQCRPICRQTPRHRKNAGRSR